MRTRGLHGDDETSLCVRGEINATVFINGSVALSHRVGVSAVPL